MGSGLDSVNTAPKKVVHKVGEVLENKIAYAVTKSKDDKIGKQEPVEIIVVLPEKKMKY